MLRQRVSTRVLRGTRPFGIVDPGDEFRILENPKLLVIDVRHSELEIKGGILEHHNFWHLPLCGKDGRLVTDHKNRIKSFERRRVRFRM